MTTRTKSRPAQKSRRLARVDFGVDYFKFANEEFALVSFVLDSSSSAAKLTLAEQRVLACVLAGDSNARVAERRGTRERTVANQVASIFTKLGVRSRSELASACAGVKKRT